MNPELWARVQPLFFGAVELPPAERASWLSAHCGDDPALRRELDALLSAHDVAADAEPAAPRGEGASIGDFRLVRLLGEGGFGTVHLAEQLVPVRRTVAIKVLRVGGGGPALVERFAREREVLARMSHPNIAQLFAAGSTAAGEPFFAMEYVEGQPITRFCDEHRSTLAVRLRLFALVCRGVHHAHQKGVTHRDLKPSNVLVATIDGVPVPKIIDFGIAKVTLAVDAEGIDAARTGDGRFLGTPGYMSPEQADPRGGSVDVRSDVYSLGVLLYELLTGRLPHDPATSDLLGYLQSLRERPPSRPSTAVGAVDPAILEHRHATRSELRRRVRGDLDWITLRALEHDAERRYQSASELADEIERHLRHEPVRAGPPGVGYVLQKFVRRHRAVTASAAAVVLALIVGLVAALWQNGIAKQALREAIGNRLSAQSLQLADPSPTLALLLAIEGAERAPGEDADAALFGALRNHREVWRRPLHDVGPRWVARSADDRWQLSGDETRLVLCIDTTTGQVRHRFDLHDADLAALAIDANGRRGASLDTAGIVQLLDLVSGEGARVELPRRACAIAFAAGSASPLVAGEDGIVRRVEAAGTPALWSGSAPLRHLSADASGRWCAVIDANQRVTVFAVADGATLFEHTVEGPSADEPLHTSAQCWFGGNTRWLVALDEHAHLDVIDLATRAAWRPSGRATAFAMASGAPRLVVASPDHPPRIFDLETRSVACTLASECSESARLHHLSPDAGTLLMTQPGVAAIEVWDSETGHRLALLTGDAHAFYGATAADDGRHVDALGHGGALFRWRLGVFGEQRLLARLQRQGRIHNYVVLPPGDDAVVLARTADGSSLTLVSATDGTLRGTLAVTRSSNVELALAPRADALFVSTPAGTELLRLPGGERIARFARPLRGPRCSPSLRHVAGMVDGHAMVFAAADGTMRFDRRVEGLQSVDISGDGEHLVTSDGSRNTSTVWSIERGAIVHTIAHRGFVFDACFTADGREVVSFANDATVLQIDVASGREVRRLPASTADFGSLSVDPSGRWFAYRTPHEVSVSGVSDGACRWHWRPANARERIAGMTFGADGRSLCAWLADGRTWIVPLDPLPAARQLAPRALSAAERQRYQLPESFEPIPAPTSVKQCLEQALAALARSDVAEANSQLAVAPTLRRRMPARFHYVRAAAASLAMAQAGGDLSASDRTRALEHLAAWVATGEAAVRVAETTPDLAALRTDPGFSTILANARQTLLRH